MQNISVIISRDVVFHNEAIVKKYDIITFDTNISVYKLSKKVIVVKESKVEVESSDNGKNKE